MIVTIEDNSVAGGFGAQLASKLAGSNIRVMELGWPDDFIPQGHAASFLKDMVLLRRVIAERICEEVEKQACTLLVERGMFPSREKAKASIMAGLIYVDGQISDKAGTMIDTDAQITIKETSVPM